MSKLLQPGILSRAEALGLQARQLVEGLRVGDHKSPYRGFSVEFVQNREYVPGDDIKHIDWKSYARSDRYTIKQYEQETNFAAHLLVDTSNSMRYGEGSACKLEVAKLLAASMAYVVIRQRDSASLRTFDSTWREELPASSQMGHIQTICTKLEAAPAAEKSGMGPLLQQLAERITRRGLVFLISDCFDETEQILKGLRNLRFRGHEVVLFHVLHKDETDFPLDGNIRFVDLEGSEFYETRPHLLRPSYLKAVQAYLAELQRGCETSGVDYVRVSTERSLAVTLGEYMVRRLQQGKR
ncbi:MAG: DUF58 domain-containing protein [Fimbriiglobus sp.]